MPDVVIPRLTTLNVSLMAVGESMPWIKLNPVRSIAVAPMLIVNETFKLPLGVRVRLQCSSVTSLLVPPWAASSAVTPKPDNSLVVTATAFESKPYRIDAASAVPAKPTRASVVLSIVVLYFMF